ncbi:dynamin family protein [Clostridium uliginosum]|uniref:Dynamin family protein n=1 Tax=Clostridium uliginosum TaxID=119641 RepID=A0A1I1NR39_9CLOT|nr:dynamin family protein [Clostridium uliginosum]SFC99762.1 Dynamin family protein [Clostridium uliginosum]
MLKKYGIDDSKLFKVAVVSTMSSGKSTFINALIGQDVLPSQNQACTAKIIPILDNDTAKEFSAYVEYNNGDKEVVNLTDKNVVDDFNFNENIKDIVIEGNITGIRNRSKATVLIDTPGTNFSGDDSHQEQTYKFIESLDEGLILYLINATQIGINDDLELMTYIKEKIKKSNNKLKILFVINKMDEFDLQKEDVMQSIKNIKSYIINNCVSNPKIIPISALAAKLFKICLSGKSFTRKELRDFNEYYELFKPKDYNLNLFSVTNELSDLDEYVKIGNDEFKKKNIIEALNNTGINLVEKVIEEFLLDKDINYTPKLSID